MTKESTAHVSDTSGTEEVSEERVLRLPRMMNIKEAANLLGVFSMEVYRLVQSGELPGVRLGGALHDRGTIWIHPRDVCRLIEQREREANWSARAPKGDGRLCAQHVITFGHERARQMTDMMIRLTGAGCPCTWGEACLFRPEPRGDDAAPSPSLLHVSAVAKRLGLTIRQVKVLCEQGQLASEVIGAKSFIPAESVAAYVGSITAATGANSGQR